jgi:DNA-binding MurR/RpiR family transcriptional regulator
LQEEDRPLPNDAAQNVDARDADSVEDWLRSLLPLKGLGASAQQVFNLIVREPAKASFLPAAELADLAQTSVSSVTRAAQRVGYGGWPDFQRDLRARHIAHLSVLEVSDAHADGGSPFQASLRQDADSLSVSLRKTDDGKIARIAKLLAGAESIYVTAQGSFSAVGHALVHNIQIAGYPVRELLDRPASVANHISQIRPGDVLIVCSYWRLYDLAVIAAAQAHSRGATVVVLADNISPALEQSADEIVITPAEGTSFFPSLTAAMAVQQGIVATLATIDPERTRRSLMGVEENWRAFKLLHRSVPSIQPHI